MTREHTIKAFDDELARLQKIVLRMGDLAGEQMGATMEALIAGDATMAESVFEADAEINRLEAEVDKMTLHMLALRQPMAIDLRAIISGLKMASELERIADYAANISRRIEGKFAEGLDDAVDSISRMAQVGREMLAACMKAYAERDVNKAITVWHRDNEIDAIYHSVLAQLREVMAKSPDYVDESTVLLYVARCLERTGDHITNLAEQIHFLVEGSEYPGDEAA